MHDTTAPGKPTGDRVVLGIHSHVDPNTEGSFNQFVDGHAWISVTRNGQTETYGLWPDDHPDVVDNGRGTDIRRGMETGFPSSANRYFELNAEQARKLETALSENVSWRYTNTCASWASETVQSVTGQRVNADDTLGLETPRQLIESIRALERTQRTGPDAPLPADARAGSSSLGAVAPQPAQPMDDSVEAQLARLINDPQRQAAWNAQVEAHRAQFAVQDAQQTSVRDAQAEGVGRA